MQVRRGACPALLGRESTARSCGWDRQWSRSREWSRSDRAGTARVNHETRDGEMVRTKTLMTQTPFFHELEPCVCVTRMKMCKCDSARAMCKKNVRATSECMYTLRRTHCSRYYMCTKPRKMLEKLSRQKLTFITPWPSWQKNIQFVVWNRSVFVQNPF